MPKNPMVMTTTDIKNAMIHPDLIKHLHGFKISDQWGELNGREIMLSVYRLCERYEELLEELNSYKDKK